MDRSLDEIVAERQYNRTRGSRRGGGDRRGRQDYPRDGVRKSYRDDRDDTRNLDSEWVHDKFDDDGDRRPARLRRRRDSPPPEAPPERQGAKLRVENIHWDLSQSDLDELFNRIGPVRKVELKYDRAGRSEGIAFVTYESVHDARQAIREFDGANANGQPIRLTLLPSAPAPRRNPFDTAVMPGRPLADRITMPSSRSRSPPSRDRDMAEEAARRGIDRYVPGGDGGGRDRSSRSPLPYRGRREGGRRPGARRDEGAGGSRSRRGGGGDGEHGRRGRDGRPRKTQEELDAEMADYFGNAGNDDKANGGAAEARPAAGDDIDMIE